MTGKDPYFFATWSRLWALSRCCQSGVRSPGRRRGISSARAAFSRKRAPKSAVPPSSPMIRSSTSSGSRTAARSGAARRRPGSGTRSRRPTRGRGRRRPATPASGPRRRAPTGVHPGAERREDADAPVADLVAEALDDDRPVRGHRPGRLLLLPQERHQVPRRQLVERVVGAEPLARLLVRSDASSREALPIASPSSYGRPGPRPSRTGSRPEHPAPARRGRGRA